ncbi:DUF1992 domain-containing protein [Paenalkalicoccus suaedae]|uniref:DUF1992 domain-containing protein n=1 Tax=Paenalkalicoccus suaedae TaxID=2592382 RepID=A0A859FAU3_9BACI|nr:DnaJ family domain-containing protein [Paenalkalicoccus suaedae]QKS70060.1 DUF1992 domain-containing protein [Paenalkalicoccus suaedae]
MGEQYNDLIGDIIKKSGGLGDIKGKGEPLPKEYMERDTYQQFQKIARDQGFLPEWLQVQKLIYQKLVSANASDLDSINALIRRYNKLCPAPMQKGLVDAGTLKTASAKWK